MAVLSLLFIILIAVLQLAVLGVAVYGIYLSFQKAWYIGLAALVFPVFGFVVGSAKLFNKELLK